METNTETSSELTEPIWAVVTDQEIKAVNVSYEIAYSTAKHLQFENVPGVCVVTAESAMRAA